MAPEASIAMVKVARSRFALSTQIMRGIKFLIDKGKELNMPLAINMNLENEPLELITEVVYLNNIFQRYLLLRE